METQCSVTEKCIIHFQMMKWRS